MPTKLVLIARQGKLNRPKDKVRVEPRKFRSHSLIGLEQWPFKLQMRVQSPLGLPFLGNSMLVDEIVKEITVYLNLVKSSRLDKENVISRITGC